MKKLLLIILLIEVLQICKSDINLDTYYKTYIESFGYNLEEHEVTTEDGYILSLWHITSKKFVPNKVVYFQHGLVDTAMCFFQNKENSLPFLLLEQGYDIWAGNSRGNIFSTKHTKLNPKDKDSGYWDFTMDQKVQYDLPATFDYIKKKTHKSKLDYIAHSQGTTIFFMLYMHNPSLIESTISHFVALGTVPNVAKAKFTALDLMDKIYGLFKKFVPYEGILNLSSKQRLTIANFCKKFPIVAKEFFDIGASLTPSGRTNYKEKYTFLYYYPGGTSKMNLLHWGQIHKAKQLVYFNPNYKKISDLKPYNTNVLKKWKINALIERTDDDTLSSYDDVTALYNMVENKKYMQLLDLKLYNHIDCMTAESAVEDIYYKVLNFLRTTQ